MKRKLTLYQLLTLSALQFGALKPGANVHRMKREKFKPAFSDEEKQELERLSGFAKKAYVREISKKYFEERNENLKASGI